ncbi:MAG: ribonuclease P protein component [Thermovirgaceae bacterium]|nr:ribonuclease P protein component [Thermovirgaceae bacterium]
MPFRYPRQDRLRKGWQFDLVFRTGRRENGALVRLLFVPSPDGKTRFGVAVGKQQGSSPVRSRGKRVLRESLRRLRPWVREGFCIICMLRNTSLRRNARDIYEDLAKVAARAGLMEAGWPGVDWNIDRGGSA